jgi:hypothetical protein
VGDYAQDGLSPVSVPFGVGRLPLLAFKPRIEQFSGNIPGRAVVADPGRALPFLRDREMGKG